MYLRLTIATITFISYNYYSSYSDKNGDREFKGNAGSGNRQERLNKKD